MAMENPTAGETLVVSDGKARSLLSRNHLLSGYPSMAWYAVPSEVSLASLTVSACSQAAVVWWRTVLGVNWDKAWLPTVTDAATSLWRHLLEEVGTIDISVSVTLNRKEELLYKGYCRFLWREACYPYGKDTKDVSFTAVVTRFEQVEGENVAVKYEVKALNSSDKEKTRLSKQEVELLGTENKPGYWFHGTKHSAAVNILEEGIKPRVGEKKKDFSSENGFYLSPKFTYAKKWAMERNERAAVLVFNLSKPLNDDTFQMLDLRGKDTEENARWRSVVKYNRCGNVPWAPLSGDLRKELNKADYIIGPMSGGNSTNCPLNKELCQQWKPQRHVVETWDQLCVKTNKAAEVFGSLEHKHIEAVIFYGD